MDKCFDFHNKAKQLEEQNVLNQQPCWNVARKYFEFSRFTILIGWYDLFGPSLSCEKTVAWWPRGSKRIARFMQQRLLVRFFVLPFLYISTIPIVFYNSSILRSSTREEPNRAWQNGLSVCRWQSCGRYWRPQIQGTVTENLPSTAEAYQICKCSLRSTFPIPRTSLMTIPSPLDLANNVVKNKHFSGSGGGSGGGRVKCTGCTWIQHCLDLINGKNRGRRSW